ncbi:hypothetical protein IOD13_02015 [Brevibacterium casei]|nr:hypothetical protein [Brevibacterium casei]
MSEPDLIRIQDRDFAALPESSRRIVRRASDSTSAGGPTSSPRFIRTGRRRPRPCGSTRRSG